MSVGDMIFNAMIVLVIVLFALWVVALIRFIRTIR